MLPSIRIRAGQVAPSYSQTLRYASHNGAIECFAWIGIWTLPGWLYFQKCLNKAPQRGLIDLIRDFTAGSPINFRDYVVPVRIPDQRGLLDYLPAGSSDTDDYIKLVQGLDWTDLYDTHGFGEFIEEQRVTWKSQYDFVLVDSRTGITDIGGICTVQLPELLIMLFTANEQSLSGIIDVARRAKAAHNAMPVDRGGLVIVPVPSRFDSREEYDRAEYWQQRFVDELEPFFGSWASRDVPVSRLLGHLTVPYVSYWSFGEELPALMERDPSPEKIGYSLDTVAAAITHRMTQTTLLAQSRDSFVAAAQRSGSRKSSTSYDILLSHARGVDYLGNKIAQALEARGLSVTKLDESQDNALLDEIEDQLARSRHLLVLIDDTMSSSQISEVNAFLRQSLEDEANRKIITVLTPRANSSMVPSSLTQFHYLTLESDERWAIELLADRVSESLRVPLLIQEVTESERRLGSSHRDTLTALSALARTYFQQSRFNDAAPLFERIIGERERVLGNDHPDTVDSRFDLARTYTSENRLQAAVPLFEQSLADWQRILGENHPDTLTCRNSLANAYRAQGRLHEAVAMLESTLFHQRKVLGIEHPDTLTSQDSLAGVYLELGSLDNAISMFERSLYARRKVLGIEHAETLQSASNVASAYAANGRLVEAIRLYEQTLNDQERVVGSVNPATMTTRNNLAIAYASEGRLDDAVSLLERTVLDRERTIGPDHPDTYKSEYELGRVYVLAGRIAHAISTLAEGSVSRTGARSKAILAQAYSMMGRATEAANAIEEAMSAVIGEDHDPQLLLAQSWSAAAKGDMTSARMFALTAADSASASGSYYVEVDALHLIARYGDGSVAGRLASVARRSGGPLVDLQSRHAFGVAADDGVELDNVASAFQELGALLYAADASAQASAAHDSAANRQGSAESAATASRLAALCGGAVTPALRLQHKPLPLTTREREIASLAASGMTNREIAERLTVSLRTVEGHLYRAATKLDVADRDEVAALVRGEGL